MLGKNFIMKKAYILISVVILITMIGFFMSFQLNNSSYNQRILTDTYHYLQARILARSSKELAKFFLYAAKNEGKECLNFISFNYPKANDTIRFDYLYPLGECENFRFKNLNQDANLSKDGVIIVNISIALNSNKNVNEEIFVNQKFFINTKEAFWIGLKP